MKQVKYESDYAPGCILTLTQSPDGDIIFSIHGDGECRIATDGGKLCGETMVGVTKRFSEIIDILLEKEIEPKNMYYWHMTRDGDIPEICGKDYLCEINGMDGPSFKICTYGHSEDLDDTCFYHSSVGSHRCDVIRWTKLPE